MQQLTEKMTAAAELSARADKTKVLARSARHDETDAGNKARNAWNDVADLIIQIVHNDEFAKESKLGKMVDRLTP